jgi:hypothetical protein
MHEHVSFLWDAIGTIQFGPQNEEEIPAAPFLFKDQQRLFSQACWSDGGLHALFNFIFIGVFTRTTGIAIDLIRLSVSRQLKSCFKSHQITRFICANRTNSN